MYLGVRVIRLHSWPHISDYFGRQCVHELCEAQEDFLSTDQYTSGFVMPARRLQREGEECRGRGRSAEGGGGLQREGNFVSTNVLCSLSIACTSYPYSHFSKPYSYCACAPPTYMLEMFNIWMDWKGWNWEYFVRWLKGEVFNFVQFI